MFDFQKIRDEFKGKTFVKREEVLRLIQSFETSIKQKAAQDGNIITIGKIYKPSTIRRYDVVVAMVFNCPHPCLVYHTDAHYIYAIGLTSKQNNNCIYEITQSRFFNKRFATFTTIRLTHEQALNQFACVFDNENEADAIFLELKTIYNNLSN